LEPISLYGTTKVRSEQEIRSLPNTISLRLATVFGVSPRMRLDLLVNDFVYRAATDGYLVVYEKDFKRNYVHIHDVAECFCFCLEHFEELKGEVYNLGLDSANLSKEELAMTVKKYVPTVYVHFADVANDPDRRNYIVSSEKMRHRGFSASTSLDVGIDQLLKAYRMLPNGPFTNA
jgi:nucleoside-diphosphate-sugar epimerase